MNRYVCSSVGMDKRASVLGVNLLLVLINQSMYPLSRRLVMLRGKIRQQELDKLKISIPFIAHTNFI